MQIKQITDRYRNDFSAIMICEGCEHEQKIGSGYDDHYYHTKVIPEMKCENCKKNRLELGLVSNDT